MFLGIELICWAKALLTLGVCSGWLGTTLLAIQCIAEDTTYSFKTPKVIFGVGWLALNICALLAGTLYVLAEGFCGG